MISSRILSISLLISLWGFSGCSDGPASVPVSPPKVAVQTSEEEFAATLKKAEMGNADAQFNLGAMYYNGTGVLKDTSKALDWWQKAALQGNAAAQFNLGVMYSDGEGVPKDTAKALDWWQKAAAQGEAKAQFNLGLRYFDGEGVPKDIAKALDLWQKAAAQGEAKAQFNLGVMYYNGEGVLKDAAKAVEWWQKAAVQGNADAQLSLGLRYSNGEGVPVDHVLAYAWSNLAAAKGVSHAKEWRTIVERMLSPRELQEATRLSSNWRMGQPIVRESLSVGGGNGDRASTLAKRSTGTVFVVGKDGAAITNAHVVEGCTELRMEGREGVARVMTTDAVNDLALLKIPGDIKTTATLNSAPDKLRQGEDILVYGFPLNAVLSSGGNLTPGMVSALTGLGNNTNQIQITAPIQPGSSGSPVLNKKAEVVGVVSMKLSDAKMVKATGSVGQNVNFAVSGLTLKAFLETHKVSYRTSDILSFEKSAADLAEEARKWTFVVECWK